MYFAQLQPQPQPRVYFKIETLFPKIAQIQPVIQQMDDLVEARNLHALRLCVGLYLVKLGMFDEELIKSIDDSSRQITHTGTKVQIDTRTHAERLFDECVFWRNEFVELFYHSAANVL